MPVRAKAVDRIIRELTGGVSYNNVTHTARVGGVDGEVMDRDEYDRRYVEPVDRIFEIVVDSIDWNRVMLEASARHGSLASNPEHDERNVGHSYEDVICPECLCEALMASESWQDWKKKPRVPRRKDAVRR